MILSYPLTFIGSAFNFTIFGINFSNLIFFVLSISIVGAVVAFILGRRFQARQQFPISNFLKVTHMLVSSRFWFLVFRVCIWHLVQPFISLILGFLANFLVRVFFSQFLLFPFRFSQLVFRGLLSMHTNCIQRLFWLSEIRFFRFQSNSVRLHKFFLVL